MLPRQTSTEVNAHDRCNDHFLEGSLAFLTIAKNAIVVALKNTLGQLLCVWCHLNVTTGTGLPQEQADGNEALLSDEGAHSDKNKKSLQKALFSRAM